MGQPAPELLPDLPLSSDTTLWIPAVVLEKKGDRDHGGSPRPDDDRHRASQLRPPPLFRSIGLTGLSASLPPHRRLRSVLHRERAVLPANASGTAESWSHSLSIGSSGDTITPRAPDRGLPSKGHRCSSLFPECTSDAALCSRNNSLPGIATHKLGLIRTRRGTGLCRESHSVSEAGILGFNGSQLEVDKNAHLPLRPNNSLTDTFLVTPVISAHRPGTTEHCITSKTHVSCRKSMVWPLSQREVCSSDTVHTEGKKRRRQRRKINPKGAHSQSGHTLTENVDEDNDLCQWMRSLRIIDRQKDHASADRTLLQERGSPRQKVSNRKEEVFKTEPGDKGVYHRRRDRRPHFLPPISQLDCLLNVPLILPENSPPPSPSCASADPFFPLYVPAHPHRDSSTSDAPDRQQTHLLPNTVTKLEGAQPVSFSCQHLTPQ